MTRLTVSETAGKAALKKSMEFFRTFRKSFLEMADLRKQLEPVVLVNTKNFVATHTVCHDILPTAVRAVLMNSVCFLFLCRIIQDREERLYSSCKSLVHSYIYK